MEPVVVDLPPELREFVDSNIIRSTWKEPADFLRHLVEQAHERWAEEIEKIAEEAIDSGPATPWTAADVAEIRQKLRDKYGAKDSKELP
ncbi:MAG: hypothetical protein U0793_19510 [Gemmataceae bacterium]